MADNKFAITITAVDAATKTINKVNSSLNKAFRPYDNAKKSVKSFTDALGRNDLVKRPLWALEKVGKGVSAFGNAFGLAENSVVGGSARIAASLGMIGGPIGGLLAGTAALVGGTAAVSVAMAKMGMDVTRTAQGLNIGTTQLQEYRGAAKMAGLQTETMDSGLKSLGETLQDSLAGRNLQVATLLGQMGVSVGKTKDGAVDTVKAFRDISDVVSHMSDQNQARKLTDMLGITELLPLLREGSGKMDEYIAKARQVGAVMDEETIQRNKRQADAWNETKTAIDGAGVSVGNLIAKYLDLNNVAAATTAMAQRLQKEGPSWRMLAENIWNNAPQAYFLRKMFGEMHSAGKPEGSGGATGSWGAASAPTAGSGSGPMGIRNNNPGNLRSWPGAGSAGGFATFGSPQDGLAAMGKNLLSYQDKHGINTLSGIVNRWAPASDNNNTGAYISNVSRQTGFGPNQPLDLHNPQVLAPLISAITKQENGQNPYSQEQITQAVSQAMQSSGERPITVVVQNVPQGMTVKPVRGLGQATVGLTMAPGGMS